MATNKARAFFMLGGYHFNPDDVTKIIGIEPTNTNATGAGSGMDKPQTSIWELSTEVTTEDIDVYKLVDTLIKQIEPVKEKVLGVIESHNLSPQFSVELTLSIDKNESCPDVGLGSRAIRFFADIGAFINIDYKLSERV